eukprot:GEMP01046576.1.p1 GENE.GEMP01046576.1~~GEMP01046576.1.p1  ORF type:complete len:410 (+),score=48.02 GEMP01046576.1:119-1348(+)
MIAYSGSTILSMLFRVEGSTLLATFVVCIWPAVLSFFVTLCMRGDLGENCQEWVLIPDGRPAPPFSAKVYSIVLGYVVVFRTNMAISRYWEGISNVQIMFSKWLDAFSTVCGFIAESSENSTTPIAKKLDELKDQLAHWYTLMSALAILRLCSPKDMETVSLCQRTDNLRRLIHETVKGREIERRENGDVMFHKPYRFFDDPNQAAMDKTDGSTLASKLTILNPIEVQRNWYSPRSGLDIIGPVPPLERASLDGSQDKVIVVAGWITTALVIFHTLNWLSTPAPILTRTFQELSSGLLGFNQAAKVTMVPFPFPFTQLITLNLVIFLILCPITMAYYTGHVIMAPMITLLITMGYWGLNDICNELENPYGEDANDLPLFMIHKDFVSQIDEVRAVKLPGDFRRAVAAFK